MHTGGQAIHEGLHGPRLQWADFRAIGAEGNPELSKCATDPWLIFTF